MGQRRKIWNNETKLIFKKQKYVVDYSHNFVHPMAFGIYYGEHFWWMDSLSAYHSACGNRHPFAARQKNFVEFISHNSNALRFSLKPFRQLAEQIRRFFCVFQ